MGLKCDHDGGCDAPARIHNQRADSHRCLDHPPAHLRLWASDVKALEAWIAQLELAPEFLRMGSYAGGSMARENLDRQLDRAWVSIMFLLSEAYRAGMRHARPDAETLEGLLCLGAARLHDQMLERASMRDVDRMGKARFWISNVSCADEKTSYVLDQPGQQDGSCRT